MGILSAKRAASLLAASAGVIALTAAAGPGTASAACANINGQGSSLQGLAHSAVWAPIFRAGTCTGITIGYTPNSSGAGLTAMGANGASVTPSNDEFIGTDDAPRGPVGTSTSQIARIISNAGGATGLEVIPAAQAAITVLANLPVGCTATGPLVPDVTILEQLYDNGSRTFNQLFPSRLTGSSCADPANPIARSSTSGTTLNFKHYLASSGGYTGDTSGDAIWGNASVARTATSGGNLVTAVNTTDGTVGYANLADAAAAGLDSTVDSDGFWLNLRSAGGVVQDPQTFDGTTGAPISNCQDTSYPTAPASTQNTDWSTVFPAAPSSTVNYPLCALTYILAYNTPYQNLPARSDGNRFTFDQGDTAREYAEYMTGALSGQLDILQENYQALPSSLQPIAAAGAARIN